MDDDEREYGDTDPKPNRQASLIAERDRLIERNKVTPQKRNETRIWNINLELAATTAN